MASQFSPHHSDTSKNTVNSLGKSLELSEDIKESKNNRSKKISVIAEKISKLLHQNSRAWYSIGPHLREYRTRKKLETLVDRQLEHITSMRLRIDNIERERAHQQRRIEQLENFIEEKYGEPPQAVPVTEQPAVSLDPREHETEPHSRKSFRLQRQSEQKPARKNSPSFERFRDYLELKRQEARELTEDFKQSTAMKRGSNRGTAERPSALRRNQKEQQPLLERTKQSYEKYRQYIDYRVTHQLNRTQHMIARRQRHETSHEQLQRQQRQQYNEQRSNLILAVLVFTLLVLVAISIVQLVV